MRAKQVRYVSVHGRCGKCGYYISGELRVPLLIPDDSKLEPLLVHQHFTVNCPVCYSLINLVNVEHKPLKKLKRASLAELYPSKR